jgi:hypothetical protein
VPSDGMINHDTKLWLTRKVILGSRLHLLQAAAQAAATARCHSDTV